MVVEEGDRRGGRRRRDHLVGDGEDAAGHGIPGGDEAETSPETVMTSAKVRLGT
jgi:hypothetical protein